MKLNPSIFAVLCTALLLTNDINAEITIDDYSAGTTLTQFGAGTANQTTTSISILGNQRKETITVVPVGENLDEQFFGALGFSGEMDVAQGSKDEIHGGVTYDNFGVIDMTEGGLNDSFKLGFLSSDTEMALVDVVSLTVTSGAMTATKAFTVPPNSSLPQNALVKFSEFTGVDMSAVDSVSLNFDFTGNPGRDFEIGLFAATRAIPEPSTGIFAALAMLALARRRR